MARRRKQAGDSGEYQSNSTIDREPREPRQEQAELFDRDAADRQANEFLATNPPANVDVTITLAIKSNVDDTTIKIPLGEVPADQAEELIALRMRSEYLLRRLRAVCGRPREDSRQVTFTNAGEIDLDVRPIGSTDTVGREPTVEEAFDALDAATSAVVTAVEKRPPLRVRRKGTKVEPVSDDDRF